CGRCSRARTDRAPAARRAQTFPKLLRPLSSGANIQPTGGNRGNSRDAGAYRTHLKKRLRVPVRVPAIIFDDPWLSGSTFRTGGAARGIGFDTRLQIIPQDESISFSQFVATARPAAPLQESRIASTFFTMVWLTGVAVSMRMRRSIAHIRQHRMSFITSKSATCYGQKKRNDRGRFE